MKNLQISAIFAVLITAGLSIALVLGVIDSEQLTESLTKSLLVIGILALSGLVVAAIANKKD